MKKNYYTLRSLILITVLGLFLNIAKAQPIIQNLNGMPIGTTFNVLGGAVTSGNYSNAGVDQTWNFSSVTLANAGTLEVINPANVSALATQFPTANYGFKMTMGPTPSYQIFILTSTYLNALGKGSGLNFASWTLYTAPGRKEMKFPFNYGDVLYDEQTGTTMTYDAYGTLILPGKTYNNILRVKYVYSDNAIEYHWFNVSPFNQIVLDSDGFLIMFDTSTDIKENNLNSQSVNVYPNPVVKTSSINYQVNEKALVTAKLYDMTGREVKTLVNEEKVAGNYAVNLDAENLNKGIYLIKLQLGDKTNVKKVVLN